MTIFKYSIKTVPAPLERFLTAYFSESIKDRDVKFLHNLHSSLQFMLSKFGINISINTIPMIVSEKSHQNISSFYS